MPISLYDAVIPSNLQMLGSVEGLLGKAEALCEERGMEPKVVLDARLADDMLPLAYQIKSTAEHSWGALKGVRNGLFAPDVAPPPPTFEALRERLAAAREGLSAVTVDEMESFVGREMRFEIPGRVQYDFTADHFLLSFSQPNFYFHAATAYGILRAQGAPIGKRDFLGAMRIKR